MKRKVNFRMVLLLFGTIMASLLLTGLTFNNLGAQSNNNPIVGLIEILTSLESDLLGIGEDVQTIESKVTNPEYGLEEIKAEVQAIEDYLFPDNLVRSSGLFGIPAGAASVDWVIINNSTITQTFTVTVYKVSASGPKTAIDSTINTVGPNESYHNANHVGIDELFVPGFYYEVVLETTNPNVLPSVNIWEDFNATVIPGTLIPPGSWVRLE